MKISFIVKYTSSAHLCQVLSGVFMSIPGLRVPRREWQKKEEKKATQNYSCDQDRSQSLHPYRQTTFLEQRRLVMEFLKGVRR
jgi:hypothetical protein